MFAGLYILDENKEPVACGDYYKYAKFMADMTNRRVALDEFGEGENVVRVSTVFLGLEHGYTEDDKPILFETLVFDGMLDGECIRTTSWTEALEAHKAMLQLVLQSLKTN